MFRVPESLNTGEEDMLGGLNVNKISVEPSLLAEAGDEKDDQQASGFRVGPPIGYQILYNILQSIECIIVVV